MQVIQYLTGYFFPPHFRLQKLDHLLALKGLHFQKCFAVQCSIMVTCDVPQPYLSQAMISWASLLQVLEFLALLAPYPLQPQDHASFFSEQNKLFAEVVFCFCIDRRSGESVQPTSLNRQGDCMVCSSVV